MVIEIEEEVRLNKNGTIDRNYWVQCTDKSIYKMFDSLPEAKLFLKVLKKNYQILGRKIISSVDI